MYKISSKSLNTWSISLFMECKIQLIHECPFYYLLVFDEYSENSTDHELHSKICFPYKPETQQKELENARNFSKNFRKGELDFKFEEKL